ncbi:MAG: flotillin-like protein FloA [Verrucomicrobia bacterium]|nr:flotillin-like protein FloA [Verrucomicrobiota bacterium]
MEIATFLVLLTLGVIAFVLLIVGRFISLWFQAFVSGTHISLFNIIGMSMRKIPPRMIVSSMINLNKAGIKDINASDLETHYLAGGRISDVVRSVIAADKANIKLDWRRATAIDLAGRDVFDAVRTSVNPKVIDCPSNPHQMISAVAQNGIELLVRVRVTVRTNIAQLVGGATEETIIARVGEGIVNAIGSAETHYDVLKNPQSVSELVLSKGLDAQTAFEILSIDIADIHVGKNVGALLQSEQALADMKVAQARAEGRKAMAVALEQEYKAKVVEAESKIPLAIASAFERGQLGIMDYNRLKNIQADTEMRLALATDEETI